MNHSIPIPRKPAIKEESPFVEIMKLIIKLAITADHHGNKDCSRNAKMEDNPIFIKTLNVLIILKLMSVKK